MRKVLTLLVAGLWVMLGISTSHAQTETYEFVTQWGSLGSGNGQFGYDLGPRGIALDGSGNVYVCDYGNQRIQVFTESGTFQYSFYSGYCAGIVYSNGHLYFTRPAGSICKYTTSGTQVWVRSYSAPGWTLNGICLDSDGNLHVCSGYYNKVYKIDTTAGDLIQEYPVPDGAGWIASDNNGHVYIASGAGPILRYTNDGVYDNSRIDLPPAERAESITLDGSGNIFVGTVNHLMRKYDPNWNLLAEWGGEGNGPGQFTNPGGIAVDNHGYVYVSDGGGAGENRRIQVFRPSGGSPAGIELVGQYTDKPAYDLKVRGNYAYVTTILGRELYILDISDPETPILIGTYAAAPLGVQDDQVREVTLIGDYAYITRHWGGFEVIDVTNPAMPTKVGPTYSAPGVTIDFVFSGDYGFLASREGGVHVYDVSDPANPVYVTTYSTSTSYAWASSITISGNYLYIGIEHSPNGFEVFDISNPAVQNKVGTISGTNSVFGIATDGDYVYHSGQWENTFNVVDVSNPSNPVRVGSGFPTHGDPWGIAVVGSTAFLGERGYGLQILDISNPASPTLIDEYDTGGDPHWGIQVVGDYVYLADGSGGVKVLEHGAQPPGNGSIAVTALGYERPCNATAVLADATVHIYSSSFDTTLQVDETAYVILPVPYDTYNIDISAPGYMPETKEGVIISAASPDRSVTAELYPETASLVGITPEDGEIVNGTKAAIHLNFNKQMDLNSLNNPNLLTVTVDGSQINPNDRYFIIQDQICPETYHLYGDPVNETEIEFGYDKHVEVFLSASLLDEDGNSLAQDYSFSFQTKSEYLYKAILQGSPQGGHYLDYGCNTTENTKYVVGIKGDLDPEQGETVTYRFEIAAEGNWETPLPLGCNERGGFWPDIEPGNPRYFNALVGRLRVEHRDDAVETPNMGARWKFQVLDDANNIQISFIEMFRKFNKCYEYYFEADPDYQTLIYHALLSPIPFGSTIYDMSYGVRGFHELKYTCDPSLTFSDREPNLYDYYEIPLFFDSIFADENSGKAYDVRKMTIEIPMTFKTSTPIRFEAVFKPVVANVSPVFGTFDLDRSNVFNEFKETSVPAAGISPNGQFGFSYSACVNVQQNCSVLDPLTPIDATPSLVYEEIDSRVYYDMMHVEAGEYGPENVYYHPIQLALYGSLNPQPNKVTPYRMIIKPLGSFTLDKHAGYLYLRFNDLQTSLGSFTGEGYGDRSDILCSVTYVTSQGNEITKQILGPAVNENHLNTILGSLTKNTLSTFIKKLPLLGLLFFAWDLINLDSKQTGVDYAAPLLWPPPPTLDNRNDIYTIELFADEFQDGNSIKEIHVDIPLIFHDLPGYFDLFYYGRPWKASSISTIHSLLGGKPRRPRNCGNWLTDEYHIFDEFYVDVGRGNPECIFKGHSPITLVVTDPTGNSISREVNTIAGATFAEYDADLDGTNECEITIQQPFNGQYTIQAIPNPDACPEDLYSITITWAGQGSVLADEVQIQDIPSNPYVFNVSLQPKISGTVSEVGNSGLLGVAVDITDSAGLLAASVATNSDGYYECTELPPGLYTASVIPPLGYEPTYNDIETRLLVGSEKEFNFYFNKYESANEARPRVYWAHQLHKALQNKPKDYSLEDFSDFAGMINVHFNQNQVNPVDFYSIPQPGNQADSLNILKKLLHMRNTGEWEPFLKRLAKSQLMALMLNIVSGKVSQTHEISADGRTVSQLITYSDMLVSDEIDPPDHNGCPGHGSPWFRYIYASFMLVKANLGLTVPAGMIPEDVIQIAYKQHNEESLPNEFALHQNYPNPFNPTTEISFSLPEAVDVKIEIYNIMGQKVATLTDEHREAGEHIVQWNGSNVASGVYLYRLQAGEFVETRKMVLLK